MNRIGTKWLHDPDQRYRDIPGFPGYRSGDGGSVIRKEYVDSAGKTRKRKFLTPDPIMSNDTKSPTGFYRVRLRDTNGKYISPECGALVLYSRVDGWNKDPARLPYAERPGGSRRFSTYIENLRWDIDPELMIGEDSERTDFFPVYEFVWPNGHALRKADRFKWNDCRRQLMFELKHRQGRHHPDTRRAFKEYGLPSCKQIASCATVQEVNALIRGFNPPIPPPRKTFL